MENNHQVGMAGGTITGIWTSISTADLTSTIIMSCVGAIVSFAVSALLKRLTQPPSSEN